MSLEKNPRQMAIVPSSNKIKKLVGVAAGLSDTLKVYEQTVIVVATAGSVTITLPNVTEAMGNIYSIYCTDLTSPATVTVQDQNESLGWSDLSLTADNDNVLLYSDGVAWKKLIDVTT